MLDALPNFLFVDRVTERFVAVFIVSMVALYLLSTVYGWLVPDRRVPTAARPAGGSPIQRRAKAAAVGFAHGIASLNITPNQVTLIGLLLVVFNCVFYLYHRSEFILGSSLIISYLLDTLDGVVARFQGRASKFGGFLDAAIDRYQEVATYLVVGIVTGLWLPVFLAMTGSMLTSYHKARTAIEIPVDNKGWPDLLGRPVRAFLLCTGLIGNFLFPWLLEFSLWGLAVMTHFTALQRVFRAHVEILKFEGRDKARHG